MWTMLAASDDVPVPSSAPIQSTARRKLAGPITAAPSVVEPIGTFAARSKAGRACREGVISVVERGTDDILQPDSLAGHSLDRVYRRCGRRRGRHVSWARIGAGGRIRSRRGAAAGSNLLSESTLDVVQRILERFDNLFFSGEQSPLETLILAVVDLLLKALLERLQVWRGHDRARGFCTDGAPDRATVPSPKSLARQLDSGMRRESSKPQRSRP